MIKPKIPLLLLGSTTVVGALVMLVSPSVDRPEPVARGQDAVASSRSRASASPVARAPAASPGAALRQHQSELRHDVNALRQELEALQHTAPASPPESEREPEVELEPDPEEQEALAEAIAESYEQLLGQQEVDAAWADERQDHYTAFFAAEPLEGSWVNEVSCGSTLCRLEVASNTVDDRSRLIDEVSNLLEPNAQGFAHIEGEGDLEIQIYLSRQDTELPVFEG